MEQLYSQQCIPLCTNTIAINNAVPMWDMAVVSGIILNNISSYKQEIVLFRELNAIPIR